MNTNVQDGQVEVDTAFGKIKGIPIAALGWVVMAAAFGFMVYTQVTTDAESLRSMAEEMPKQTILLQQILDAHKK